jgi:hypothetical protein
MTEVGLYAERRAWRCDLAVMALLAEWQYEIAVRECGETYKMVSY